MNVQGCDLPTAGRHNDGKQDYYCWLQKEFIYKKDLHAE